MLDKSVLLLPFGYQRIFSQEERVDSRTGVKIVMQLFMGILSLLIDLLPLLTSVNMSKENQYDKRGIVND